MSNINPNIEESRKNMLKEDFNSEYFKNLKEFLINEKKQYMIYPPSSQIFAAFDNTPFNKIKVVIIGQDPYHGPNQANGLCFSVNKDIKMPPSLQNIFKEINSDLGISIPSHGDLSKRAQQGILLLNATLTVRAHQAGSHQGQGRETFTNNAIKKISDNREGIVFLLWGNFARKKKTLIDQEKHYILEAPHPSPYSANRGFFGCKHFSKTNEILKQQGKQPINRQIE